MLEKIDTNPEGLDQYDQLLQQVRTLTTLEFLQAILPEHGIHYLALFKEGYKFPAHKVYTDLETMADAIDNMAGSKSLSIYHACATYQRAVIEIEDGEKTKRKYRIPENWDRAKAFWVDIDCGQEKFDKGDGYLTKRDAAVAIDKFSVDIGWPKPMLVDSGNGLHAYWPLTKDISHDKWVKVAKSLKATLLHCGVLADPTRTADFASILRPAGSVNRKNGEAKSVTVLCAADPAEPDVLDWMLTKFMVGQDVVAKGMPFYEDSSERLNGDLTVHQKGEEGRASVALVKSALHHLDPGMSRDKWRTVVWAVRHGLGDTAEGIDLADLWSKGGLSAEFNTPKNYSGHHDVEQVWNSYDSNKADRISVSSLFKMATDNGWTQPGEVSGTSDGQSHGPVSVINAWTGTFKLSDGDVSILPTPPAKRSYILANTVTAGTYNVLAGSGGTLKTMLMLITAASMAVGKDLGV